MQVTLPGYGKDLEEILKITRPTAPEGSLLYSIAIQIRNMASCYVEDGAHFFKTADPVNSYASFSYASGWLDCGHSLGFITCHAPVPGLLFSGSDLIPYTAMPQLTEKTNRYARLLEQAVNVLVYAAEPGTLPFESAQKVLLVAEVHLRHGRVLEEECRLVPALGSYSYGHAWLDAGLRAGFFRVVSDRDLFTL